MKLVPNISAPVYTLSAITVGLILLDDTTPAEQNSLGNWFMLVGQVLCSNAAQQQVLNNRSGQSDSSNEHIVNNNPDQINMLKKAVGAMNSEIDNLKNNL